MRKNAQKSPKNNGEGEIRTRATLAGRPVFETGAFNHSATSPGGGKTVADSAVEVKAVNRG